ncbi:MAG: YcfL family protein [Zoogloeaceae bacterium]|jgi:uncharacterized protein YcfL|nr:YcfL family protein [Zoogloeaceae bacterium]
MKKPTRRALPWLTLAACLTLGALPACTPNVNSKTETLGTPANIKISDMRGIKGTETTPMRVQVTFTNTSSLNARLYYRVRWLDNDGFTVWEDESWKPEVLHGQQNKIINLIAPTTKATDFKVEMRNPASLPGRDGWDIFN